MVPFQIALEERPTYLHAKVVGPRTPENAQRYLEEVYAACVRTGLPDVLLEMCFSGPSLGAPGIFQVISRCAEDGAKLRRVAYVEASMDDALKPQFAETVARNRAVNIRLFFDIAEARRWLLDEPGASHGLAAGAG
jgi:hypothetical protein